MTDTTMMVIKIVCGVAIVVTTVAKIVINKKNRPEEATESEETTE